MQQLHLIKWHTAIVILMGAGCQFALAGGQKKKKGKRKRVGKEKGVGSLFTMASARVSLPSCAGVCG